MYNPTVACNIRVSNLKESFQEKYLSVSRKKLSNVFDHGVLQDVRPRILVNDMKFAIDDHIVKNINGSNNRQSLDSVDILDYRIGASLNQYIFSTNMCNILQNILFGQLRTCEPLNAISSNALNSSRIFSMKVTTYRYECMNSAKCLKVYILQIYFNIFRTSTILWNEFTALNNAVGSHRDICRAFLKYSKFMLHLKFLKKNDDFIVYFSNLLNLCHNRFSVILFTCRNVMEVQLIRKITLFRWYNQSGDKGPSYHRRMGNDEHDFCSTFNSMLRLQFISIELRKEKWLSNQSCRGASLRMIYFDDYLEHADGLEAFPLLWGVQAIAEFLIEQKSELLPGNISPDALSENESDFVLNFLDCTQNGVHYYFHKIMRTSSLRSYDITLEWPRCVSYAFSHILANRCNIIVNLNENVYSPHGSVHSEDLLPPSAPTMNILRRFRGEFHAHDGKTDDKNLQCESMAMRFAEKIFNLDSWYRKSCKRIPDFCSGFLGALILSEFKNNLFSRTILKLSCRSIYTELFHESSLKFVCIESSSRYCKEYGARRVRCESPVLRILENAHVLIRKFPNVHFRMHNFNKLMLPLMQYLVFQLAILTGIYVGRFESCPRDLRSLFRKKLSELRGEPLFETPWIIRENSHYLSENSTQETLCALYSVTASIACYFRSLEDEYVLILQEDMHVDVEAYQKIISHLEAFKHTFLEIFKMIAESRCNSQSDSSIGKIKSLELSSMNIDAQHGVLQFANVGYSQSLVAFFNEMGHLLPHALLFPIAHNVIHGTLESSPLV